MLVPLLVREENPLNTSRRGKGYFYTFLVLRGLKLIDGEEPALLVEL